MKQRIIYWSILGAFTLALSVSFGGSITASNKMVKVGGPMNHCDCTYRIE